MEKWKRTKFTKYYVADDDPDDLRSNYQMHIYMKNIIKREKFRKIK